MNLIGDVKGKVARMVDDMIDTIKMFIFVSSEWVYARRYAHLIFLTFFSQGPSPMERLFYTEKDLVKLMPMELMLF